MQKRFEAVYENGVLRPLEALLLPNNLHVTVTIENLTMAWNDPSAYFSPEEWETAARDEITLREVHQALSSIPGSLSDAVVESREER
jgi:predicted DNA-binding antitoxin AbrB/MazE fold protein